MTKVRQLTQIETLLIESLENRVKEVTKLLTQKPDANDPQFSAPVIQMLARIIPVLKNDDLAEQMVMVFIPMAARAELLKSVVVTQQKRIALLENQAKDSEVLETNQQSEEIGVAKP
ncbi:hypothetical protein K6U20_11895 [Vibrio fluvialis]|uniref:hypothetical protein n=1 Tax=Vibrio fluvialis TaxID=676 RepID=UPI001EEA0F5A|nr:hypothetical protein [Vibrio fluvialis]MCG6405325.1 hypothetical protein [Vibrio fluvialis]